MADSSMVITAVVMAVALLVGMAVIGPILTSTNTATTENVRRPFKHNHAVSASPS